MNTQSKSTALLALTLASTIGLQAQSVVTEFPAYLAGQPINIDFTGGPGNPTDWIGVYPDGTVPDGNPASTLWNYVGGSQAAGAGLTEGRVTFPGGLAISGDWTSFLLLRDGYTVAAQTNFVVLDATSPLVQARRRVNVGTPIDIAFFNGPGNTKDWIGIYKEGQTPGTPGIASTIWSYVDGQGGSSAVTEGTVTFKSGLPTAGRWVAFLLENDGYNVLASQTFETADPTSLTPRILSVAPADGATGLPPVLNFVAKITNATTSVSLSSVKLLVDGKQVAHQATTVDGLVTVTYNAPGVLEPLSSHTYQLTFTDTGAPAKAYSAQGTFTVGQYQNIVLGPPIPGTFENFDAVPEGQVPAGWSRVTRTDIVNPDIDFGNLDSAAYAEWTVVNVDRFKGTFVTYSNPDDTRYASDYQRVLSENLFNVVNGAVLHGPLANGRMLFANSGYRNGTGQYEYLFTPDYDLSGKTGVAVSFHSLWEQNQDSIAALEFSTDKGTSWKPVFYLLHSGDIVKATDPATGVEVVDAEATFNTERGDVARWTDPDTGETLGGTYAAYIAAPVTPALAPYIQARLDDNPVESKRVEYYLIPGADNQKTVRFRFSHSGTDSWYWGIDDFGLYQASVTPVEQPALTIARTAAGVTLSWPATATGFVLQQSASLTAPSWQPVPNVSGNSAALGAGQGHAYFRLAKP